MNMMLPKMNILYWCPVCKHERSEIQHWGTRSDRDLKSWIEHECENGCNECDNEIVNAMIFPYSHKFYD